MLRRQEALIFLKLKRDAQEFLVPRIIKNKTINTTFFEGSATMTSDGKTMYFVTDRNYEKKATDLWVVKKEGRKWGQGKSTSGHHQYDQDVKQRLI